MAWALPLPVAIPLLGAALMVATDHLTPRLVHDFFSIGAAAAALAFSLVVLLASESHDVLHWFGGWHPDGGVALGIVFSADPFGAAMASLATGLVFLSLIYSLTYMREESRSFDVLMLCFGGAMAGFSLTGDIFNMFVWFELMGVCAYALAGFKIEELGPVQGAFNFAITNTLAAYMILSGIALLYARTGILNLAQIGHELARDKADRLVIVALTLIFIGLMVKAAIVPFHFWLADAHAAAPAPVCVLFSGAMVELGIYFIARVYWTVFDGSFHASPGPIRVLLVVVGVVTMLVGALMCFLQRHLKRLLAYSTISHAGAMLAGVGLLDSKSLAGVANLILGHAFLKGGLFLACGIVLIRLQNIDELKLRGAGRDMPVTAVLWFAATLGLVGIPYVGIFLGHGLLDDGAIEHGYAWLPPIAMVAAGVCAGAMLRAGARVFLGWGAAEDELLTTEPDEKPQERDAHVPLMATVTGAMIAFGLVASVIPGLEPRSERASERFIDRAAYAGRVLHGVAVHGGPQLPFGLPAATTPSLLYGCGALLVALAAAAGGLWYGSAIARVLGAPLDVIRGAHSGIVGDYLLWIVSGTALVGTIWAFTLP